MKLKTGRVILAISILIVSAVLFYNLLEDPTQTVVNKVLEHDDVKVFVEARDEAYDIALLSVEELEELKKSQPSSVYSVLPNEPVYRVLITEGNRGYLAFLNAQTKEIIDITEVYNFEII